MAKSRLYRVFWHCGDRQHNQDMTPLQLLDLRRSRRRIRSLGLRLWPITVMRVR